MHHFNETETQLTYRGPWAFYYSQHIIALIISLGQNTVVQNVILSQGLYFFTLFSVLFLSFIHGFLPTCGRKTDYIINMALVIKFLFMEVYFY